MLIIWQICRLLRKMHNIFVKQDLRTYSCSWQINKATRLLTKQTIQTTLNTIKRRSELWICIKNWKWLSTWRQSVAYLWLGLYCQKSRLPSASLFLKLNKARKPTYQMNLVVISYLALSGSTNSWSNIIIKLTIFLTCLITFIL